MFDGSTDILYHFHTLLTITRYWNMPMHLLQFTEVVCIYALFAIDTVREARVETSFRGRSDVIEFISITSGGVNPS
jgi:hypothetical protein